jgi:hypothetical protein
MFLPLAPGRHFHHFFECKEKSPWQAEKWGGTHFSQKVSSILD